MTKDISEILNPLPNQKKQNKQKKRKNLPTNHMPLPNE